MFWVGWLCGTALTSKRVQDTLNSDAASILSLQHVRPQILLPDSRQSTPGSTTPQTFPQRLRPNDEQIPNLRKHLETRREGRIERPRPQQLDILGHILCDDERAGGVDLEFFEVVDQLGSEADGDFG